MAKIISNKRGSTSEFICVLLLAFVIILAISNANFKNQMMATENILKENGFTIIKVSKINATILLDTYNITDFMRIAHQIGTSTVYEDIIMNNGIGFVILNGTIGWNYKW